MWPKIDATIAEARNAWDRCGHSVDNGWTPPVERDFFTTRTCLESIFAWTALVPTLDISPSNDVSVCFDHGWVLMQTNAQSGTDVWSLSCSDGVRVYNMADPRSAGELAEFISGNSFLPGPQQPRSAPSSPARTRVDEIVEAAFAYWRDWEAGYPTGNACPDEEDCVAARVALESICEATTLQPILEVAHGGGVIRFEDNNYCLIPVRDMQPATYWKLYGAVSGVFDMSDRAEARDLDVLIKANPH